MLASASGEPLAVRSLQDRPVEGRVGLEHRPHRGGVGASLPRRGDRGREAGLRLRQASPLLRGGPLGRELAGHRLQPGAELVHVGDVIDAEASDPGPAVRLDAHDPFRLQHAEGLSHRRARHRELLGDPLLHQPLARPVVALHDPAPDHLVDARGTGLGHGGQGSEPRPVGRLPTFS